LPRFDQDRSFVGYIGIGVDVTERKVAEEFLHELNRILGGQTAELRSREELLKTFVKNVPSGVAMLDRDMRYLQVSDRWCADFSFDSSHADASPITSGRPVLSRDHLQASSPKDAVGYPRHNESAVKTNRRCSHNLRLGESARSSGELNG
jgi:PAS domain-containing protein